MILKFVGTSWGLGLATVITSLNRTVINIQLELYHIRLVVSTYSWRLKQDQIRSIQVILRCILKEQGVTSIFAQNLGCTCNPCAPSSVGYVYDVIGIHLSNQIHSFDVIGTNPYLGKGFVPSSPALNLIGQSHTLVSKVS